MPDPVIHPGLQAMAGGSHGALARTYFHIKPYIPHALRMALRRFRMPRIMRRNLESWPILESASAAPADWPGWPDGRRFALVFTHDVESQAGIDRAKRLAELETEFGFRSSFNLIPEGSYPDPVELREWLAARGFEVGVHDLNHDGHLYESRETFRKKARSINSYLRKWGAVGFRSGFMLRQLDWLHELNVLYDTSTFDTDPFEPQPEGSRTIFPFVIDPPDSLRRPGYVELSYTLPQDSTLFLLLREKTPQIWQRKLDWIVRHGGLALVNIHPDYIDFDGGGCPSRTYPASLLREFLQFIRDRYEGDYWNPLARELAAWFRDVKSPRQG